MSGSGCVGGFGLVGATSGTKLRQRPTSDLLEPVLQIGILPKCGGLVVTHEPIAKGLVAIRSVFQSGHQDVIQAFPAC